MFMIFLYFFKWKFLEIWTWNSSLIIVLFRVVAVSKAEKTAWLRISLIHRLIFIVIKCIGKYYIFYWSEMCDCICCDCWWCGLGCVGCGLHLLMCGCWMCKPYSAQVINPQCCLCWEKSGCGGALICIGVFFCIPIWLRTYAVMSRTNNQPVTYTKATSYPVVYQWFLNIEIIIAALWLLIIFININLIWCKDSSQSKIFTISWIIR